MINLSNQQKYLMGVAQQYATDPHYAAEHITPDNKSHEGIDSAGLVQVAPWLPVQRYSERFKTHVVISSQTPVAIATHKDTGKQYLVPAGYSLADNDTQYTDEDVRLGVKNAAGEAAVAGTQVKASFASNVVVSSFVGIVNYDVFMNAGGDGINPTQLNRYNYNPQPGVSYNMDYAYCYPLVKDEAEYKKAPLKGIAAFVGKDILAGQFVTYNKDSNFVVCEAGAFGYGSIKPEHVVGQIQRVDVVKDPDNGKFKQTFNHLDMVHNGAVYDNNPLNQMPGSRSPVTTQMAYANAYGLVHFALQRR